MIDPKGRPVVRWRLKLQRPKKGRQGVDARIGMEMATLVDDEGMPVDAGGVPSSREVWSEGKPPIQVP